jgi:3-keto-disaccharide hydrolase
MSCTHRSAAAVLALLAGLTLASRAPSADEKTSAKKDEEGFVSIFDGKTLNGWHPSAKTGHSRASKNTSGGKWVAEDGAIIGSQDIPGNGGILITDKKYGDFEVVLEMKNDFGPDSGLFLRSTEDGKAYQAMIDYHPNGNLMGVYGEGIGGLNQRNFTFGNKVTEIIEDKSDLVKLPISPEKWPEFWKHGEWQELRARIEGNPPKVTTWIKGVKFMEVTDDQKRLPDAGGIALQVHGGGDLTKQFVRYRNIRVKEIK